MAIAISGKVRDIQATGMQNITVKIKGTNIQVKTNKDGYYQINASTGDLPEFILPQYETVTKQVGVLKTVNVLLSR